jgi:hypothetical protein
MPKAYCSSVVCGFIFSLLMIFGITQHSYARNSNNFITEQYRGKIGRNYLGMDIVVRNHVDFVSGYYYIGWQDVNIPLSAEILGKELVLSTPNGVSMHLHFFTGRIDPVKQPLNFYNSLGLKGSWTNGKIILPVQLHGRWFHYGIWHGSWYGSISSEPDSAFEAHARQFLAGALSGNRRKTAGAISFPLHVWNKTIQTKKELYAQWNQIFTPQYLAILRTIVPHDMLVENGRALAANGAVQFDGKGAKFLEVP